MNIGLYFGSFNPIHIGHLAIANYMVEFTDIDKLWFIISPHNPFKKKSTLLEDYHRLELVYRAIENDERFLASDIEFKMPQPSYTIDTLVRLKEKRPNDNFSLIMGADGLKTFNKWKNAEEIVKHHHRYVYPRPGIPEEDYKNQKNMTIVDAPLMEISSSFVRSAIKENKNMRFFVPEKSYDYICEMNFYRNM